MASNQLRSAELTPPGGLASDFLSEGKAHHNYAAIWNSITLPFATGIKCISLKCMPNAGRIYSWVNLVFLIKHTVALVDCSWHWEWSGHLEGCSSGEYSFNVPRGEQDGHDLACLWNFAQDTQSTIKSGNLFTLKWNDETRLDEKWALLKVQADVFLSIHIFSGNILSKKWTCVRVACTYPSQIKPVGRWWDPFFMIYADYEEWYRITFSKVPLLASH